jgi:hypothetical protein
MAISHNVIFDKFLSIESWAFRARHLVEKGEMEKAKQAYLRIRHDLEELGVLLKVNE